MDLGGTQQRSFVRSCGSVREALAELRYDRGRARGTGGRLPPSGSCRFTVREESGSLNNPGVKGPQVVILLQEQEKEGPSGSLPLFPKYVRSPPSPEIVADH